MHVPVQGLENVLQGVILESMLRGLILVAAIVVHGVSSTFCVTTDNLCRAQIVGWVGCVPFEPPNASPARVDALLLAERLHSSCITVLYHGIGRSKNCGCKATLLCPSQSVL
jgi:hypothetical protein